MTTARPYEISNRTGELRFGLPDPDQTYTISTLLCSAVALRLMAAFIACVSLYDIWLVYLCRNVIFATEQNPICLWLIAFDPQGLSLFVAAKISGTICVIVVCDRLVRHSREIGAAVTHGLTLFQAGLLVYLTV